MYVEIQDIGALADEYYHDSTGSDIADEITTYITELFNAIRKARQKNDYEADVSVRSDLARL